MTGTSGQLSLMSYTSEDLVQRSLATHPSLVAGDQMGSGKPRRWLLIARERIVPDEDDGTGTTIKLSCMSCRSCMT